MFINFIKTAFRYLIKRKTYSLINLIGLAIGIASFILIMIYVMDELGYDRHHERAEDIYRMAQIYDFEGVGENSASLPFPVAFTLKDEYPGIVENICRIFNFQAPRSLIEYGEQKFNERRFFFADSTYFEIFRHKFIQGDPETALDEINAVVITASSAKKYFGDEDPMGKILKFEEVAPLKVSGVIEDVPGQSHFIFDFMGSMASVKSVYGGRLPPTWVWNPCWTYMLLAKGANPEMLEEKFPEFIEKYFYDAEKDNITLYLQALTDIHLESRLDYEIAQNNNKSYIYILTSIAVFLLVIAGINFMNLSTATSGKRAREIGIKKAIGVSKRRLIFQFLGESLILTYISLILAIIIVELTIPSFNTFTGKNFDLAILLQPQYIIGLILLGLFIGLFSGLYPAFYLSAFRPLNMLKGDHGLMQNSGFGRKVLVVIQFTISIALIIGTMVVFNQLNYLKNADLGFKKENIMLIPVNRTPVASSYNAFSKELLLDSRILNVTAMDDILGGAHNTHEFRPEGLPEDKWQFYPAMVVMWNFVETFNIKILAGRNYKEKNKSDPVTGMLINEAMVKHMGWRSNEDAIGKKFRSLNGEERVIGVINNFHVTSLHAAAGPFVLNMKEKPREITWFLKYVAIKYQAGKEQEVIDLVNKVWMNYAPSRPFEYSFLDQELRKLYDDEDNLSLLSMIFTFLILLIAGLGIFGLVSFMAEKRTKEIGIRKVLGAETLHIILLLSVEFFWLIIIASGFAWIISWLLITDWLNHFAYRISLNWLIFLASALIAMLLALIITTLKAWFASKADPVDTIKYE
ncbi:MAG: ABC transporter permease [Bacteroidales bacterium]|nr:ABC transporter permease [Bacteroidales bacterium]